MVDAIVQGLWLIFQWPAIGFLLFSVMIGVWFGAIPGLHGGTTAMVLILPFTFGLDPASAITFLLATYAVSTTSDTISSILLGIPGSAASQATILDGYPLAQQGQAARAFGAAFFVSALGGVFGGLVVGFSLPIMRPLIMTFGSLEFFMLAALGLMMVSSVSGSSILKGLAAAAFGMIVAMVGYALMLAVPRFTIGSDYLLYGIHLAPFTLGLFAIPEIMELAIKNTSIARVSKDKAQGDLFQGIRDVLINWWLALRCALIGAYIGVLPGLGSAIVDWIAYGHAVQSAKDKSKFGKGDIRGVIAPEAANNAIRGGALIPTLAFGIPGSAAMAILMGALFIHGLSPGTQMLSSQLHITYSMMWTIILANILAAVLLLLGTKYIAKMAFIPGNLFVPGILVVVFMGAWMASMHIGDWLTVLVMGIIGFFMKRGGWPRPPLMLGFVLAPIMERNFEISVQLYDAVTILTRPATIVIIMLLVTTLVLAARGAIKPKISSDLPESQDITERNPLLSLPVSLFITGMFVFVIFTSLPWPMPVKRFPLAVAIPGLLIMAFIIWKDIRAVIELHKQEGTILAMYHRTVEEILLYKAFGFMLCIIGMIAGSVIVGQMITLPLFVVFYLLLWGRYTWGLAISYGMVVWLVLVIFYDHVLEIFWYSPLIFG